MIPASDTPQTDTGKQPEQPHKRPGKGKYWECSLGFNCVQCGLFSSCMWPPPCSRLITLAPEQDHKMPAFFGWNPECDCQPCKDAKELYDAVLIQRTREEVLRELGKLLNSRIAKMEILHSQKPYPFKSGILEAYRDVEKWELDALRTTTGSTTSPAPERECLCDRCTEGNTCHRRFGIQDNSALIQRTREEVLAGMVFEYTVNVPSRAFPSIKRKKLAINDIGDDMDEFTRVPFELHDKDKIIVLRQPPHHRQHHQPRERQGGGGAMTCTSPECEMFCDGDCGDCDYNTDGKDHSKILQCPQEYGTIPCDLCIKIRRGQL